MVRFLRINRRSVRVFTHRGWRYGRHEKTEDKGKRKGHHSVSLRCLSQNRLGRWRFAWAPSWYKPGDVVFLWKLWKKD